MSESILEKLERISTAYRETTGVTPFSIRVSQELYNQILKDETVKDAYFLLKGVEVKGGLNRHQIDDVVNSLGLPFLEAEVNNAL